MFWTFLSFSISQKGRRHHLARYCTKTKQHICKHCIGLLMLLFPHILETRTTSTLKAVMLSPAHHPIFFMLSVLVLYVCFRENHFFKFLSDPYQITGADRHKKTPSDLTRTSNSIFWPLSALFNFCVFWQKWVSGRKIDFFNFICLSSNFTVLKLLVRKLSCSK